MPALLAMGQGVLRLANPDQLADYFFNNPYFAPNALFAMRPRGGPGPALGFGLLIEDPAYADARQIDAHMPCFRLGAFGSEGMQTKRLTGLFSLLARPDQNFYPIAMDLLGHAALKLHENDEIDYLAAQVPSDAPHLLRFYSANFRRQGSFPVLEYDLTPPAAT